MITVTLIAFLSHALEEYSKTCSTGHDSSVKADDLKAAFEAKGATVVDAYVPEGKPFGFVSFGSQEDGEKYGTMMNGV